MPVDTKRIVGPESTVPYRLYSANNIKNYQQLLGEVLTNKYLRTDERRLGDARKIFAQLGCITQAKGSVYVEMGNTKVTAAVYEPRETPKQTAFDGMGDLYCEVRFAPFSTINRSQLLPGNEEREMAATLRRTLEPVVLRHLFPNFQVDIFVYVMENDGSCLATIINAAGLALADAEVPMYDMIVALTIGVQGSITFVDPNSIEERLCLMNYVNEDGEANHGITMKAMMPQLEQITELFQRGAMTVDRQLGVLDSCGEVYEEIYKYMQAILIKKCKTVPKRTIQDKMKSENVDMEELMACMKENINIS